MIILDTHIWLWWVNQDTELLKPLWMETIEQADKVGVSAISLFKVAWLAMLKLPDLMAVMLQRENDKTSAIIQNKYQCHR